ncbi:hypothetical protein AQULUS_10410 [Aquicella lusitana]|uniref:Uncharacterized protein n=1 Tax=Aquicella lusitana TaxID=254246 RepID=A0A370GQY6_9COXI|nr:hypothetical protein C8D86_106105 [Aquicella lusitana]VVC73306.1 hypothetical protein AQULUS_10410 [Aquicella lusitana]
MLVQLDEHSYSSSKILYRDLFYVEINEFSNLRL